MESKDRSEKVFSGIAASPGIAHGQIYILAEREIAVPKYAVAADKLNGEQERLDNAIVETRKQIQKIQEEISDSIGEDEARIFDAHLLVLEDQALIDESIREMRSAGCNVENAIWKVGQRYIEAFDQIDDEYLRERASDIRDVMRRLLSNLTGQQLQHLGEIVKNRILVANDVTPSDSASMDQNGLLGIVTVAGSKTSHAVIVARSLGIPAVVGLGDIFSNIHSDSVVLVDGYDGKVVVNPSEGTLFKYGKLKDKKLSLEKRMIEFTKDASRTRDGSRIDLMANIERAEEAAKAVSLGADGVGLFRSEYLFMNSSRLPTEEEQFEAYQSAVRNMNGLPVTIRTLDLGGDKVMDSSDMPMYRESNPFLGYRAIRFCLDHEKMFLDQLRAILRASAFGKVRIMYPMISGALELSRANQVLEVAKEQLREKGTAFDENVEAGAMIEIPSAAVAADTLVEGSKFFSVGTNDLIQYLLAVDRLNDRVAHLYEPTHPAVVRTLKSIVDAARAGGIGVSICGEVAGDPVMVPLLVGLGVDSLSMSPALLPNVKFVVQNMDMAEAKAIADMALETTDGSVILERLLDFYTSKMDQLY
ncbi:phosphoenolpyruvate--protein phosphotransferase [Pelagicoccus sp. NFK12]|uniref:Phosphoenolpyruvate-protein phosphotransferase n=1 Tax=Pelagicoccus enzymogenes TaxID=2773457 RepID=A0A927FBP2_9BACT|nr:phosphoenolpyruvate--protein phosphotransferase [Pelagicoccus enzymogenes]MBD5782147.1 phosphoenolpyruvate--protein phosphotransferase [Pelagicoccus enzymogenes]MDQ8196900.1 phosphoenolpyruvate--protein phosphotransferase [Pelagicoccus enzymogenes]